MLLIVMNVVLLTALWMGYRGGPGNDKRVRGGDRFLEQKLELSTEQTQQLKELRKDHFDRMTSLREEFQEARKGLHDLWKVENGTAKAEGQAEKVGDIQADIELEVFTHFSDIREICDDKQKAVLDSIIEDVLRGGERRGGPDGNRPPRGKGPGPGGNLPPPDGR